MNEDEHDMLHALTVNHVATPVNLDLKKIIAQSQCLLSSTDNVFSAHLSAIMIGMIDKEMKRKHGITHLVFNLMQKSFKPRRFYLVYPSKLPRV